MHRARNAYFHTALVLTIGLLLAGCSASRVPEAPPEQPSSPLQVEKDDAVVEDAAKKPPPLFPRNYRVVTEPEMSPAEPVSGYDILQTSLDLEFDFSRRAVKGTAHHKLVVVDDSLRAITMHGRGLQISSASVLHGDTDFALSWEIEGEKIRVPLQRTVHADDTLLVSIVYEAFPERVARGRGMRFVDPEGNDPSRPTQIWTIGQPEDNRMWFPTWDYPNDRMSFDITLTVPDSLATLSNGTLTTSETVRDGYRRDRWIFNATQPSYLTALAVGQFSFRSVEYQSPVGKRVPLLYAAEPQYAHLLEMIYGETPRMMEVLERKTALEYPFENLKQVSVREFTAGGMENSTLVLYGERLQHDRRAHLDYTGRDLIAHEVAHQWFGNLVTCRNWAHLALNEGFATFFEEIYLEEEFGRDAAQEHRIEDRQEYLQEAAHLRRPILWSGYPRADSLFDTHTYEKAELVLQALRFELGDESFWRGVRTYITTHAGDVVTFDDLKEAMERAVRRPLTRFFDQWYRQPGHPELLVTHEYNGDLGLYELRVQQVQDTSAFPVYDLDAVVELNFDGRESYRERIEIASVDTTFRFGISGRLSFVRFDEGDWLLADIVQRKPLEQWLTQVVADDEMAGRYDAIQALADFPRSSEIRDVLLEVAASDRSDFVRAAAVGALTPYSADTPTILHAREAARADPIARVRRAAVRLLAASGDASAVGVIGQALGDSSYLVVAEAITGYAAARPGASFGAFSGMLPERSWQDIVELAVLETLIAHPEQQAAGYIAKLLSPSRSERVRARALRARAAMARLGPELRKAVISDLEAYRDDLHAAVRREAERQLSQL